MVGVVCREEGRYSRFSKCVSRLVVPEFSMDAWASGGGFAENRNAVVRQFVDANIRRRLTGQAELEWIWFIDDDQTFSGDLLMRLLQRRVDLIQPLVVTKKPPFRPYVYKFDPATGEYRTPEWSELPCSGIHETDACAAGGLLIRRAVVDALEFPWFEEGRTRADAPGEDLTFCRKAVLKGFRCHVDLDNRSGHTAPVDYSAVPDANGEWQIQMDVGEGQRILVPNHVGRAINRMDEVPAGGAR